MSNVPNQYRVNYRWSNPSGTDDFLSAVAEGREHSPDFADGLRVQHLLAAIEDSDERGEWVEV